jgi:hypothetical protein
VPLLADAESCRPLIFRKDCGDRTFAGVFQLSHIPCSGLVLRIHDERVPFRVERLAVDGTWSSEGISLDYESSHLTLRFRGPTDCGSPAIGRILWTAPGSDSSRVAQQAPEQERIPLFTDSAALNPRKLA